MTDARTIALRLAPGAVSFAVSLAFGAAASALLAGAVAGAVDGAGAALNEAFWLIPYSLGCLVY